jgi:formate hydrogenlyase subunit 3/multisubunit Na+/H+ antiporter MnhD subunit
VSILPFLAVAFGGAAATLLARRWPVASAAIGAAALVAALVAAASIVPGQELTVGGGEIVGSAFGRLFLLLGSGTGLVLVVATRLALGSGWPANLPGALLAGLGAAGLALAVRDATTAVAATIAGGLAGVIVTLAEPPRPRDVAVAARELRAIAVAGSLVILATAWFARPLGILAQEPAVFGLAYLAVAVGVAMRFGAIPFHLWAARVADAAPEIALPVVMAWGPAALAVVGIAWVDGSIAPVMPVAGQLPVERAAVIVVGVASLVLGAVAAWIQDDLEHVVGYSIVQDAGVVILALAALDPSVWAPSRTWILNLLVARTAFAAWTMAVHARFGTRRVPELAGWARRSPVLAVALLAIAVASVGWPGLAAFDARAAIFDLAADDPTRGILLAGAFLPLLYYGRLVAMGLGRHSAATAGAAGDRPRRPSEPARRRVPSGPLGSPWSLRTWRSWDTATQSVRWLRPLQPLPRAAGAALDLNRGLLVAALVLVLAGTSVGVAAGGFGVPAAAAEPAPQLPGRGE